MHPPEEGSTWRCRAKAFGRKLSANEQLAILTKFSHLPLFRGKVSLKKPNHSYYILADIGCGRPIDAQPRRVYFLKQIVRGRRDLIDVYTLKKRRYLGLTSMDAELSLIIANQALIQSFSLVCDPFVGTGSIIVTSAHFGGYNIGSDIDPRVLRGKDDSHCVKSNFMQYNLQQKLVDLLVHDQAHIAWRCDPIFDAIICDPPYGVREGARKIGRKPSKPFKAVPTELQGDHIPASVTYEVSEILIDLLEFSASRLVLGGRLVFWFPTLRHKKTEFPKHPCLDLICESEQSLNSKYCRRLITLEKTRNYDISLQLPKQDNQLSNDNKLRDVLFPKPSSN
eukprot:TRINITY_DN7465_c1_g1_i2.p1 TRINITY_DN7465_c1_g1~~TRINITY_DN7465_c1_g1_i2.p1  ORF type:complete len:338 (-),score=128.45 TRINITY_DN7465_c1_g1_i2:33-1046(-)